MTRNNNNYNQKKAPARTGAKSKDCLMVVIPERASQRNNFHIIPLSRPRIERERDAEGWLVLLPGGHGWLVGDRRQALREFAGLVEIERWRRA